MRFLLCLLGFPCSAVVATSLFEASDEYFSDWNPYAQPDSDDLGLPSLRLDDFPDDLFSNTGLEPDPEYTLLSFGTTTDVNEWSFDSPPLSELQTLPFANLGLVAFSDDPITSFPISPDGSSEASAEDYELLAAKVQKPPPSCASLPRGPSNVPFILLCCEPACIEQQTWRNLCLRCMNPQLSLQIMRVFAELFVRDSDLPNEQDCMLPNLQRKLIIAHSDWKQHFFSCAAKAPCPLTSE